MKSRGSHPAREGSPAFCSQVTEGTAEGVTEIMGGRWAGVPWSEEAAQAQAGGSGVTG